VSWNAPLPAGGWERDERAVAWVYGSILVGAAVVVAAGVIASKPGQVPLYTASTMVVVWLAHSYAAFVGHGGRLDVEGRRERWLHALATELPVLASAAPTLIAMGVAWLADAGVGATGLTGLIASIATMAIVAAGAARRTGAGPLGIAAAAASALLLGGLLVFAKVALK
jgi:hypothetical protein